MSVTYDLSAVHHLRIDGPGVVCDFLSDECGHFVNGYGGFDQHHPWPIEMGGEQKQQFLRLCPNHHRRQHALIRALVERSGRLPSSIKGKFSRKEQSVARRAYRFWINAGSPAIQGWPCLAAT